MSAIKKRLYIIVLEMTVLSLILLIACSDKTSSTISSQPISTPLETNSQTSLSATQGNLEGVASTTNSITDSALKSSETTKLALITEAPVTLTPNAASTNIPFPTPKLGKNMSLNYSNVFRKSPITVLDVSNNNDLIAMGYKDGYVILLSSSTKKPVISFKASPFAINSIAFNPDGKTVVTGSKDNTFIVWRVSDGYQESKVEIKGLDNIQSLKFSDDGNFLLIRGKRKSENCVCGTSLVVWSVVKKSEIDRIDGASDFNIEDVAISPDNNILIAAIVQNSPIEPSLYIRSLDGRNVIKFRNLEASDKDIYYLLRLSRDGKTLATVHRYSVVSVWSMVTGQEIQQVSLDKYKNEYNAVNWVSFDPNNNLLISNIGDYLVFSDIKTGKVLNESIIYGVTAITSSKKSNYIYTAHSDDSLNIWFYK